MLWLTCKKWRLKDPTPNEAAIKVVRLHNAAGRSEPFLKPMGFTRCPGLMNREVGGLMKLVAGTLLPPCPRR